MPLTPKDPHLITYRLTNLQTSPIEGIHIFPLLKKIFQMRLAFPIPKVVEYKVSLYQIFNCIIATNELNICSTIVCEMIRIKHTMNRHLESRRRTCRLLVFPLKAWNFSTPLEHSQSKVQVKCLTTLLFNGLGDIFHGDHQPPQEFCYCKSILRVKTHMEHHVKAHISCRNLIQTFEPHHGDVLPLCANWTKHSIVYQIECKEGLSPKLYLFKGLAYIQW